MVTKSCRIRFEKAILPRLTTAIVPYMWYDEVQARGLALLEGTEGFYKLWQETTLTDEGHGLRGVEGMDQPEF